MIIITCVQKIPAKRQFSMVYFSFYIYQNEHGIRLHTLIIIIIIIGSSRNNATLISGKNLMRNCKKILQMKR